MLAVPLQKRHYAGLCLQYDPWSGEGLYLGIWQTVLVAHFAAVECAAPTAHPTVKIAGARRPTAAAGLP